MIETVIVLTTLILAQHPPTQPQKAAAKKETPVSEDENVRSFKYQLAAKIRELVDPQAMGPSGRARAAQELANMKSRAKSFSQQFDKDLEKFYKAEALGALRKASSDSDEMVREEAALAAKRIQDNSPYPKVSNGSNWVQVQEVARGGGTGGSVFGATQASDLLLEVTFKTDDPSVTFSELSKKPGSYCEVIHAASAEPRRAEAGGGDFNDPMGQKICVFAVPQEARSVSFRLKGFPEMDLRF